MKEPPPWEGFHAAVAGGHEENIRRSFEDLYKHTKDEMVRFAIYCVRKHNPDLVPGYVLDAREVVEDAFSELYLKCRNITKDPRRWILGTIQKLIRYRVSRACCERRERQEAKARRQFDPWRAPRKTKCSLSSEQRIALRKRVRSLPTRMKAVVVVLFYRDESVATAAAKLGISENAVIQARRRALKKLSNSC